MNAANISAIRQWESRINAALNAGTATRWQFDRLSWANGSQLLFTLAHTSQPLCQFVHIDKCGLLSLGDSVNGQLSVVLSFRFYSQELALLFLLNRKALHSFERFAYSESLCAHLARSGRAQAQALATGTL